jgi:CRP/FNR family transcriptional regulator
MKQLIEDRISPRTPPRSPAVPWQPSKFSGTDQRTDMPNGMRLHFAPHALVFLEADPSDRIFQIVDGAVMLYKLLPDGRRQVVELLGPGDVFGLGCTPVYDCAAESLTKANILAYDRAAIEKHPKFLLALSARVHKQICALHDHAVLLGRKSAIERVASFLMRFIADRGVHACPGPKKESDDTTIRLGMTRQEIADFLGLTIETVSRAFSELRRRGLIAIERSEEVRVHDICKICRLTGAH